MLLGIGAGLHHGRPRRAAGALAFGWAVPTDVTNHSAVVLKTFWSWLPDSPLMPFSASPKSQPANKSNFSTVTNSGS
jgi:hypothetical protein